MALADQRGRDNQRHRTRKDLLRAAAELLKSGRTPTMDEVAAEAMVSRATAYRYFPTVETLLVEAPLDVEVVDPQTLFAADASTDPVERLDRAEATVHQMTYRNEAQLRVMLAHAVQAGGATAGGAGPPVRQNRRGPLIEAALAPARPRFDDASYERLTAALALVFGTESMIVFRDVRPLTPERAREVKSWIIRVLVEAALAEKPPVPRQRRTGAIAARRRSAPPTARAATRRR
jgi:AcrR family transcriptional regulator